MIGTLPEDNFGAPSEPDCLHLAMVHTSDQIATQHPTVTPAILGAVI
jgi:hypothetical protein